MKLEHVKEIQSIFEMGHVPLVQINTHALHLQGSTALFVTVWYWGGGEEELEQYSV